MLMLGWRCCMRPMMAVSIAFAFPVAMKPPRVIAYWIESWQRAPTSASQGKPVQECSPLGTIFWPVNNAKVYWRSMGGTRSGRT